MHSDFYLADDPDYSLVDSARDSTRFAHLCLMPAEAGRWRASSSHVDELGRPVPGSPMTGCEGPGAGLLCGAIALYRWGRHDHCGVLQTVATGLVDHVLHSGFLGDDGSIALYRDARSGAFLSAAEGGLACPGDGARSALEMLWLADLLPAASERRTLLEQAARRYGSLVAAHTGGAPEYRLRCDGSGCAGTAPEPGCARQDALHVTWLLHELTARGLANHEARVREGLAVALERRRAGDGAVCPAASHAVTARLLLRVAAAANDPTLRDVACQDALIAIEQCHVLADCGGAPTRGLVRIAPGTDAASAWDNAEVAAAYLDAALRIGDWHWASAAGTVLRALARNHAGPFGFLPATITWGDRADPAAAPTTTPLGACLHHVEGIVRYQELCAASI